MRVTGLMSPWQTKRADTTKPAPPVAPPTRAAEPPTVLAIDDDPDQLDVLQRVLSGDGLKVITASTAVKGLNLLAYAPQSIQVIVLDYSMPQLDGLQTLNHIRKLNPQVKIIGLTGVKPDYLPQAYAMGVDHLVLKPFRCAELLAVVRSPRQQQRS